MELWQLEVFTAVAEEKSFSRAGHRIGRTQPANAKEIAFITEPPESGVEVSSPTQRNDSSRLSPFALGNESERDTGGSGPQREWARVERSNSRPTRMPA